MEPEVSMTRITSLAWGVIESASGGASINWA